MQLFQRQPIEKPHCYESSEANITKESSLCYAQRFTWLLLLKMYIFYIIIKKISNFAVVLKQFYTKYVMSL